MNNQEIRHIARIIADENRQIARGNDRQESSPVSWLIAGVLIGVGFIYAMQNNPAYEPGTWGGDQTHTIK